MNYFLVIIFSSLLPYLQADPAPDTNVQIQNYDGPIYLHSPKPNYCPLCNSLIPSQKVNPEPEKVPCESSDNYPRKAIYGNAENPIISGNAAKAFSNPALRSTDAALGNANTVLTTGNAQHGTYVDSGKVTAAGNTGSKNTVLSTNSGTGTCTVTPGNIGTGALGNTYTIPVTFGSAHTGLEPGNCFCGGTHCPTITGTECTCVTKPLSSFLPVNNAQNTSPCYKIPIVTCNQGFGNEDEPILVPQKFSYSLILDGEVAQTLNQNQNYPMEYCIVL